MGQTVDIVGTNTNTLGRTCEIHSTCGVVIRLDTVLRLRSIEIRPGENAIAVYWVTDGIDRCRVGFLRRHYVPNDEYYDGALVHVVEMYSSDDESTIHRKTFHLNMGYCVGAIIAPGLKCSHKCECY